MVVTDYPPDPLARAAEELGEPAAVYAVGPARVGAKLLAAFALLAYGVAANVLWWGFGPARFDHLVLLVLFAPPLSGLSMLRHIVLARGMVAAAYPNGLLLARGRGVESYPWDDITVLIQADRGEIRLERDEDGQVTTCWIDVEPPLVKFWQAGLTLRRSDGAEATLTPALENYTNLVELVQRETFAAKWLGLLDRLRAGEVVGFGRFALDGEGITSDEAELPWQHVGNVEISQGKLSIKPPGKWLPWAVADLTEVSNPHLFLAVVEELRRPRTPSDGVLPEAS